MCHGHSGMYHSYRQRHSRSTKSTAGADWSYQASTELCKEEMPPPVHLFPFPTVAFSTYTKHVSILIFFLPVTVYPSPTSSVQPVAFGPLLAGACCSNMLFLPQKHSSAWVMQPASLIYLNFYLFQCFRNYVWFYKTPFQQLLPFCFPFPSIFV